MYKTKSQRKTHDHLNSNKPQLQYLTGEINLLWWWWWWWWW